jgi:hypothetical protein
LPTEAQLSSMRLINLKYIYSRVQFKTKFIMMPK